MCVGSPTAGTWSSSQSRPDNEFETDTVARYGKPDQKHRVLPRISQETLADMVGTTRGRVNFFMKKFQRLGFINYKKGLKVNHSALTVVLHT
jgi:CRP/FNR family transcriptional regulator, cyclic AMP receptor protein